MTGSDLIVMTPWIIFAVCVAVLWVLLLRGRRPGRRPPSGRGR